MARTLIRVVVIAAIFFFVGVASSAAYFAALPGPASTPGFFDEFNDAATTQAFWHVNSYGAKISVHHSALTMKGDTLELDHRIQTDPKQTIIIARVRGIQLHKFALGFGVYHAGAIALEFDNDGVKCGRGTDHGWKIDYLQAFARPPIGTWYYLELGVINPYPNVKHFTPKMKKGLKLVCAIYDSNGRLMARVVPNDPAPTGHYNGLDEAYLRTWDSGNLYQVDWVYAGPPSGNPVGSILRG